MLKTDEYMTTNKNIKNEVYIRFIMRTSSEKIFTRISEDIQIEPIKRWRIGEKKLLKEQ